MAAMPIAPAAIAVGLTASQPARGRLPGRARQTVASRLRANPGPGRSLSATSWDSLPARSGQRGEAVPGAAYGLQGSGFVTEFAAQGADHDLDDVAAAAPVVAPYVAQQRRPADDPALAFVQVLQDIEFELGEVGAAAVEDELAAAGIEQGVVVDEHFPRGEVGQPAVDG